MEFYSERGLENAIEIHFGEGGYVYNHVPFSKCVGENPNRILFGKRSRE